MGGKISTLVLTERLFRRGLKELPRSKREELENLASVRFQSPKDLERKDLKEVESLVGFPSQIEDRFLDWGKDLRWIHLLSAGVDGLMRRRIKESDLLLTNSSGVHGKQIAEHVFAFILSFNRNLPRFVINQRKKRWERGEEEEMREVYGKTLGVLGFGAIGERVVEVGKGLGMKALATKRRLKEGKRVENKVTLYDSGRTGELLRRSDYLVVALPLTKRTAGALGLEEFEAMKETAFFVNIGRGELVRERELVEALRRKEIAGAGLDVFEEEPLPEESPLWEMENVIITPHNAGMTPHYGERALDLFLEDLARYAAGEELLNIVDKEEEY